jgi:hypothetical protein
MSVDSIGHRRLCFESAFAFPEQAARFQRKSIESHEIDEFPNQGAISPRMGFRFAYQHRLRSVLVRRHSRDELDADIALVYAGLDGQGD